LLGVLRPEPRPHSNTYDFLLYFTALQQYSPGFSGFLEFGKSGKSGQLLLKCCEIQYEIVFFPDFPGFCNGKLLSEMLDQSLGPSPGHLRSTSHSAVSQPRNPGNPENQEKLQFCIVFYSTLANKIRIFQIPEIREIRKKILLQCCKIQYTIILCLGFSGFRATKSDVLEWGLGSGLRTPSNKIAQLLNAS
jgi:hypothetical protein